MLLVVLSSILLFGQVSPISEVKLRNTVDEPFTVWLRPEGGNWVRPPVFLTRNGTVNIKLVSPGKCYILLRDMAGRSTQVGWIDLHAIAARRATEVLIDQLVVHETREITKIITEYQAVTRTNEWGEPRTYWVPVQKQVKAVEIVAVKKVELKVRTGDRTLPLWQFLGPVADEGKRILAPVPQTIPAPVPQVIPAPVPVPAPVPAPLHKDT